MAGAGANSGATRQLAVELVPRAATAVDVTLAQAVLEGEAMDSVVRDGTMVGIVALQPVLTARTTVKTSGDPGAPRALAANRLASAKQCGAARLPVVGGSCTFEAAGSNAPRSACFILVEPWPQWLP